VKYKTGKEHNNHSKTKDDSLGGCPPTLGDGLVCSYVLFSMSLTSILMVSKDYANNFNEGANMVFRSQ
jgi:hypothetical protein